MIITSTPYQQGLSQEFPQLRAFTKHRPYGRGEQAVLNILNTLIDKRFMRKAGEKTTQ
jgi:hypothetical protein